MHFICRSFIGHPSDTSWSQFWEMEPDDPALVARRGHLFGLINLSVTDNSASTRGRRLINQINQSYYSATSDGINLQLKNSLAQFSSTSGSPSDQLSLVLAVVADDQLHLAIFNSGLGILQRDTHISSLLTGQPDSVITISGPALDSDRILLCTDSFFHGFSWENIKSSLSSEKIDSIEENFLSRLYSLGHQSQLAAALIEIHQDSGDIVVANPSAPSPPPEEVVLSPVKPQKSLFSVFHRPHSSFIAHVDSPTVTRRKKINFLLAIAILVALFVSIYFGYRHNQSLALEKQYQTLKSQLQTKINNAQTVKNINLSDALTQSQDAQSLLQKMSPFKNTHATEIAGYQQTINNLLSQTGSASSFAPPLFFDTSLINNGLPYSRLILAGSSLYLLDTASGHVDKLDIVNKSHQSIAAADDIKNSQSMAENNGAIYLLKGTQIYLAQKDSLVLKVNLQDQIKDFSTGGINFWNGSLYVLSLGSSIPSIWKYAPNVTGFTVGENWLKTKQTLPSTPASFAINGNIWVISQTGIIAPYNLGVKKDFTQVGTPALTDVSNLVTSLDSNILAFTDKGSQVYVYNKTGQSVGQYNFGSLEILSIAYDPTSNSIFVLCADKKIYKISL